MLTPPSSQLYWSPLRQGFLNRFEGQILQGFGCNHLIGSNLLWSVVLNVQVQRSRSNSIITLHPSRWKKLWGLSFYLFGKTIGIRKKTIRSINQLVTSTWSGIVPYKYSVRLYEVTSNLAAQQGVWKNKKVDVMKEDFKVPVSLTDIRFWE